MYFKCFKLHVNYYSINIMSCGCLSLLMACAPLPLLGLVLVVVAAAASLIRCKRETVAVQNTALAAPCRRCQAWPLWSQIDYATCIVCLKRDLADDLPNIRFKSSEQENVNHAKWNQFDSQKHSHAQWKRGSNHNFPIEWKMHPPRKRNHREACIASYPQ